MFLYYARQFNRQKLREFKLKTFSLYMGITKRKSAFETAQNVRIHIIRRLRKKITQAFALHIHTL